MTDDTVVLPILAAGEPPADAGLPGELRAAAPLRWSNKATPVLLAAVLLAAGFLGGVQAQQHWGRSTSATPPGPTAPGARR